MLNTLIAMAMQGRLQQNINNNPKMQQLFNQFLAGKNGNEQLSTLLNVAKEKGFDVNEKMFTADDLKQCGIKLPKVQG